MKRDENGFNSFQSISDFSDDEMLALDEEFEQLKKEAWIDFEKETDFSQDLQDSINHMEADLEEDTAFSEMELSEDEAADVSRDGSEQNAGVENDITLEVESIEENKILPEIESIEENEILPEIESVEENKLPSEEDLLNDIDILQETEQSKEAEKDLDSQDEKLEQDSPFEDSLMESLFAEAENMDIPDVSPDEENPMADVEDLLNMLSQEEAVSDITNQNSDVAEAETEDALDILAMDEIEEIPEEVPVDGINELDDSLSTFLGEEHKEPEKKKKPGIWARLFGNIHDEKARKMYEYKGPVDEEGNPIPKPKKTKEQIKAEKEAKKKQQDEEKKEKADKAAEKKAAKEAKKQEKKAAKEAKKKKQLVVEEDEGRINRVGATIVFAFFGIVAAIVIMGSNTFSYSQSIRNATKYFSRQKYNNAYEEVRGIHIKDKDAELYDKIMTVMYVNKQLNSYNNYYSVEMYPEALDSLLKGLQRYDEYLSTAKELGVKSDLDYVRNQILGELNSIYNLKEQDCYTIINSENQEIYSQRVIVAASIK